MSDRTRQSLGSYRLIRLLGKGSFAEVYLGEHIHLGTWVAIKVLRQKRLHPEFQEAFKQEARSVARLVHPHIVGLLNFGIKEETLFLVEDYIPGGTLRTLHPWGTHLPVETILDYVQQVVAALQFAHDQRLIHQHIKPENMLVGSGGEVLVGDFGLVLPAQEVIEAALYMAPEQFMDKSHPASDQYALGIVVYEWLTGDVPFHGSFEEIQAQHTSSPPPSLLKLRPDLHTAVEVVLARALAKEPDQRFPSVSDFATALERALRPAGRMVLPISSPQAEEKELPPGEATGMNYFNEQNCSQFKTSYGQVPSPYPPDPYQSTTYLQGKTDQAEESTPPPPPPPSTSTEDPYAPFIIPDNPYTPTMSVEPYPSLNPVNPYTPHEPYNPYVPSEPVNPQVPYEPYTSPAKSAPEQTTVFAYPPSSATELKDFFISYTRADRLRATWVAEQLHRAGYSTFLPPVDFREGFIFRKEMLKAFSKAPRMITVLSPAYFAALQSRPHGWSSFKHAMKERAVMFFTVCVEMHEEMRKGLFGMENYIDIAEEDDATAQAMLRAYTSDGSIGSQPGPLPDKNTLLYLINSSFARKDWADVRRKAHYLLKEHLEAATPELYRMYGTALFELNYKSLAFDAFHNALTLAKGEERLPLLEDCVKALTALERWQDILNYANEALKLTPRSAFWQEVRQQAENRLQIIDQTFVHNPYTARGLALFFSYSHKDAAMRQKLEKHLSPLKSRGLITAWHDGMILAGETREEKIAAYLNQADIVLLLISTDYMASHYCYEQELRLAMVRHEANKARVIPVILRPVVSWEGSPFSKLQILQPGGKAISEWTNKDAAYVRVVKEIQTVVEELRGKL